MIPRYSPAIALGARVASLRAGDPAAQHRLLDALGVGGWRSTLPFRSARAALAAYFGALARREKRRTVVLSCQLCPIVPALLIETGFRPHFVDTDEAVPVPTLAQLADGYVRAGGAGSVAAVVVAPFYGHATADDDAAIASLGDAAVVVDMAQGLLLAEQMPRLLGRADAVAYSFGVGKGLDFGGGMLAERNASTVPPATGGSSVGAFAPLPKILALQMAVGLGVYRYMTPFLESEIAASKSGVGDARPLGALHAGSLEALLNRFEAEVARARDRAATLFSSAAVTNRALYPEIYGGREPTHLRQLLRLRDASARDGVLKALRHSGVDAMPAGEPLPGEYLAAGSFDAADAWPNARRFLADAIRLPFLGRLDEATFGSLKRTLETVLDERLP